VPYITPEEYESIYAGFDSPVSRFDCGQYCAPHNDGTPVCCSTQHAVPVARVEEWKFLKAHTDLWHIYQPGTKAGRTIKEDLPYDCRALECKGAACCERQHRSLSCRTFPFFPYITKAYEFAGLAYYWNFEDRCWVISNLQIVERPFIDEFVSTFELLFRRIPGELETFRDYSATMRRAFSRLKRAIPLIGREGGYFEVIPGTGEIRPAQVENFPKHGPYHRAE
jgi:Fe-S-cluster containining protein